MSFTRDPIPRFSIVSAVYNVARYLDDFIGSIDSQDFPLAQLEVIAVDDGSTDDSLAKLQAWARRRPGLVTVLHKKNGGQSTARNLGLRHARGEWVTFTDPDDILDSKYLSEVDAFLREHPDTLMVGTNRLILNDATGEATDTHPLKAHFRSGNRLRDLERWPNYFFGSAPCAFFRRELLRELDLTFDARVRPNFEDGLFCCLYLLSLQRPLVGFVASALYHYRKRSDLSSTLQRSLEHPGRYTDVMRFAFLYLVEKATTTRGAVPKWMQNHILYELSWYFSSQDAPAGALTAATGPVAEEFHSLLVRILTYLDPSLIADFSIRYMRPVWHEILMHAYRPESWHQEYGLVGPLDAQQGLVRLRYLYKGERPDERFLSGGDEILPRHSKVMGIRYYGRLLLHERIVWLPAGKPLRVELDGRSLELSFSERQRPIYQLAPSVMRRELAPARPPHPLKPLAERRGPLRDWLIVRLAKSWPVRRLFKDAWVLMDRIHDADDNGERLFEYLRHKRRRINAWFVLEAGTPDWRRLRSNGYRRLVPHGSLAWKLLMLNSQHLISSHADLPVMAPPDIIRLAPPQWRFTFLQHGVIKDDLSQWLNRKKIDIFVVSTAPEYESIVGDDSPYEFTTREVKLTGLPRFDRLRRIGLAVPEDKRDLILVTPTWRHWLLPPLNRNSQRREVSDEFTESDFVTQWLAFLRHPILEKVAHERGLTVGFLPHPNFQSAITRLQLPEHVRPLAYENTDVQQLFATSAVVVTDYSSIAFNAAYIDRPVVYFQFDAERALTGGHVGRKGYFDYERDGFGPVTSTADAAAAAVAEAVNSGPSPAPVYSARIDATFQLRDGNCCKRVTDAIGRSGRRARPIVVEPADEDPIRNAAQLSLAKSPVDASRESNDLRDVSAG
jgi:GT2 family glycosyltransferase